MDDRNTDLWQGGPWEQPAPVFPAPPQVHIPEHPPVRSRRHGRRRVVLFAVTLALIGGLTALAMALGDLHLPYGLSGEDTRQEDQQLRSLASLPRAETGSGVTVPISALPEEVLSYTQVYEKNAQSIVTIHVLDQEGISQGTGIVLTSDGYIITNSHVVEGAQQAMVVLSDDTGYEASLVGECPAEDLAVLKIDAQGLTPAEFGDSTYLRVGDEVSALGNPLGYRMTLTPGIISAVDRKLTVEGNDMYLLQTSAAINFGNSGGALLNDRGQVVGVTTVKIVSQDGSAEALGFAIPTQRVKYVVDQLIAGEEIKTPILGITVVRDPEISTGIRVEEIQPWSDAKEKGLLVGDVITAANGTPVRTNRDLARVKDMLKVGDLLRLSVEREGQTLEFSIRLLDQSEHLDHK